MIRSSPFLLLFLFLGGCSENQPAKEVIYPDAASEGALILQANCSFCHMAPLPAAKKATEWLSIVNRMQRIMVSNARATLLKEEAQLLVKYLQKHARKE